MCTKSLVQNAFMSKHMFSGIPLKFLNVDCHEPSYFLMWKSNYKGYELYALIA